MKSKNISKECGKRLKECIKESGMTSKELAENCNYVPQYISQIINGKRNMSLQAAKSFAKVLSVREEYLLCEDDYKTDSDILVDNNNPTSFYLSTAYRYLTSIGQDIELHWDSNKDINYFLDCYEADDHRPIDKQFVLSGYSNDVFFKSGKYVQIFPDTKVAIDGTDVSLTDYMDLINDLQDYADFLLSNISKRKKRRLSRTATNIVSHSGNNS